MKKLKIKFLKNITIKTYDLYFYEKLGNFSRWEECVEAVEGSELILEFQFLYNNTGLFKDEMHLVTRPYITVIPNDCFEIVDNTLEESKQ